MDASFTNAPKPTDQEKRLKGTVIVIELSQLRRRRLFLMR